MSIYPSGIMLLSHNRPKGVSYSILVPKALKELGIKIPAEKDAIFACARVLIEEILTNLDNMQDRLSVLTELCIDADYRRDIYDFYLLH